MSVGGSACLTRVMVDDDNGLQLAQWPLLRQRIVRELNKLPVAERQYVSDFLLASAIRRVQAVVNRVDCFGDTTVRHG